MNFEKIKKSTLDYINYIEEHYNNVQKAWKIMQEKCKDEKFIIDDFEFGLLDYDIKHHDISKFSSKEFLQYRNKFFPFKEYDGEEHQFYDFEFAQAWSHHKEHNDHHWETWTTRKYPNSDLQSLHCVHMLVDWIAMGIKFNDTALDYYKKNKSKMVTLPQWAGEFIVTILEKYYKS